MKKFFHEHETKDWIDVYLYEHVEEALNEKLQQLPSNEDFHHEFSPEFQQKMENLIKKEKSSAFL